MNQFFELVLTVLIAAIFGGAAGYGVDKYISGKDGAETNPVIVLDVKEFISAESKDKDGNLLPEKVSEGIAKAYETARALSNQGYVVIDRQSILAAPESFIITPDMLADPAVAQESAK